MLLSLSRAHFPVTALGPGRRIGIWFQGCTIRCPGCISMDTWAPDTDMVELHDVCSFLAAYAAEADGLTISGGEPFEQPAALRTILRSWRKLSNKSVLLFTGHEYEQVSPWLEENEGLIDALISGPFRSDLPQTRALRGSDNQRLHVLTARGGIFEQYERASGATDRHLDMMLDDDGTVWLAGIPARGDVAKIRRLLSEGGHKIETSDMRGLFS